MVFFTELSFSFEKIKLPMVLNTVIVDLKISPFKTPVIILFVPTDTISSGKVLNCSFNTFS